MPVQKAVYRNLYVNIVAVVVFRAVGNTYQSGKQMELAVQFPVLASLLQVKYITA